MSTYRDIRGALESRLSTMTDVPAIAPENVTYEPAVGTAFLRIALRPTGKRPADVTADGLEMHEGLFLVDVFQPGPGGAEADDGGPDDADVMADSVMARFAPGLELTQNGVKVRIRRAQRAAGRPDGPWYFVPVEIRWFAFV